MSRELIYVSFLMLLFSNCKNECLPFKDSNTKIYGIDVSHYQTIKNRIQWNKVKLNKNPIVSFAYIRSTMGKDSLDKDFEYNVINAKNNNISVGIYHYYRPDEDPNKQFEHFKKYNNNIGDLPPMIDFETIGKKGSSNAIEGVVKWLNLIEKEYKIKPIIYTTQRFYNTYLLGIFNNYDIWIARQHGILTSPENNKLKKEPLLLDGKCPIIWQFSGTGRINGIEHIVDLNIVRNSFWNDLLD